MNYFNLPNSCIELCYKYNFKFAGLQYENQCWCGNSYGSFGAADPSICNMSCPIGNRTCGGKWANDVYEITNLSINMKIFTN
jgi:hypothetical protein